MFAYCNSNPVTHTDPDGHLAVVDDLVFLVAMIVVLLPVVYVITVPPPPIQDLIYDGVNQIINDTFAMIDETTSILFAKTKGKERVRDTGLANESDAEVERKAHDKNIPKNERERYKKEEKARGLRNRQKRNQVYSLK